MTVDPGELAIMVAMQLLRDARTALHNYDKSSGCGEVQTSLCSIQPQ